MTRKDQIVTMEAVLRRHPGCTFVYHAETAHCASCFQVGVPMSQRHGHIIWGQGQTLDAAYHTACVRIDDLLGVREAA